MKISNKEKTPPVLERFELKYTIPVALIQPICRFIEPYCLPDLYSQEMDDQFYTIQSVYFDTPNFLFLQQRLARVENRFNMRIRSYGEEFHPPFFLEVKQKTGNIIKKFRGKTQISTVDGLLDSDTSSEWEGPAIEKKNRELFLRLMLSYQASPLVAVQYRRKAYFSTVDDYARITFDQELSYKKLDHLGHPDSFEDYCPCDDETIFDPQSNIILELKCYTTQVPFWMIDLISQFQLHRRGFSKYLIAARAKLSQFQMPYFREPAHIR